jgi:hypothetical protein
VPEYELAILSPNGERTNGIIPVQFSFPLVAAKALILFNTLLEDDIVERKLFQI